MADTSRYREKLYFPLKVLSHPTLFDITAGCEHPASLVSLVGGSVRYAAVYKFVHVVQITRPRVDVRVTEVK